MLKALAVLFLFGCHVEQSQSVEIKEDKLVQEDGHAVVMTAQGVKYHTGLIHSQIVPAKTFMKLPECKDLPESFDLRDQKTVPEVRNQGSCGSCWSFSKTGSLESALMAAGKGEFDLSEQEQVSCDSKQYGCQGGNLTSFSYQISHGQGLEKDFPYTSGRTGRDGACKKIDTAAQGTAFEYIGTPNRGPTEAELKCALYTSHTIPWITVSASSAWGSPPSSEQTMYARCGRGETNHAVGVTGWHKDMKSGKTAFHMKNSWGTNWGDHGYMSMPLGCDSFGDEVAFIKVK